MPKREFTSFSDYFTTLMVNENYRLFLLLTFFYLKNIFAMFSSPNYDQIKFCYKCRKYQLLGYCRIAFYFAMQFCNVSFNVVGKNVVHLQEKKLFFWLILRLWLYNEANAKVTNGLTTGKMVKRNCH